MENIKNWFYRIGQWLKKAAIISAIAVWIAAFIFAFVVLNMPLNIKSPLFALFLASGIFILIAFTPLRRFLPQVTVLLIFALLIPLSMTMFSFKRSAHVFKEPEITTFEDIYSKDHDVQMAFMDKDSAMIAAKEQLGRLMDDASVFEISEDYFTKILYKDQLTRVAPLQYSSTYRRFMDRNKGVPYYVKVDVSMNSSNKRAEIIELEQPVRYHPHAFLTKNLRRHLRFKYPTTMLGDMNFEIDDNGKPYWIVGVMDTSYGLWGGKNASGVIVVDAYSGDSEVYTIESAPKWVDRIFPTNTVLNHAKNKYKYQNGFLNTIFDKVGIKDVATEEGNYNYIAIDGDINLITGLKQYSNANRDDENTSQQAYATTGMLFINNSTGHLQEIAMPGIDFKYAEEIMLGDVREKDYTVATPSMINIGGYPTYVAMLKDSAGLSRGYGLVNYENYSQNVTARSYEEAKINYLTLMGGEVNIETPSEERTVVVDEIYTLVVDGNSMFYLTFENDDTIYTAQLSLSDQLPFIKPQDTLSIINAGKEIVKIEKP